MDVDALEAAARSALAPEVYDYFAGGAFDEVSLAANLEGLEAAAASPPRTAGRHRRRPRHLPARGDGARCATLADITPDLLA